LTTANCKLQHKTVIFKDDRLWIYTRLEYFNIHVSRCERKVKSVIVLYVQYKKGYFKQTTGLLL
jgi:hypothetical protein